jgi:hypothetical protein
MSRLLQLSHCVRVRTRSELPYTQTALRPKAVTAAPKTRTATASQSTIATLEPTTCLTTMRIRSPSPMHRSTNTLRPSYIQAHAHFSTSSGFTPNRSQVNIRNIQFEQIKFKCALTRSLRRSWHKFAYILGRQDADSGPPHSGLMRSIQGCYVLPAWIPELVARKMKFQLLEGLVGDTLTSVAYLSMPRSQISYIRHIHQTAATVRGR